MSRTARYYGRVANTNRWTAQEFMQRIGRTPAQKKVYNVDGSTKKGYSTTPSQQNSQPVARHTGYNSVPQNVYKAPSPPPAPAPAPPPPAPRPAPAPAPAPSPSPPPPVFNDRVNTAQKEHDAAIASLSAQMAADRANYERMMKEFQDQISGYQSAFNQGSSVGGQEEALMINPADSAATKKKRRSKGTQQFNRNLKISNVSI